MPFPIPFTWAVPMEWVDLFLTFIVEVIQAGAWPAAIIFVVFKLQEEFSNLIRGLLAERMTRAQTPVGTFEFGLPPQRQDAEAEEAAEAAQRALPAAVMNPKVQEILNNTRQRMGGPEEVSEALALQLFYERVYRFIYRSQMQFLEYLESIERPAGPIEIQFHYGFHTKRAEERALDQEAWLGFLYDAGFIEEEEDGIAITQSGRWYLTYCDAIGYTTSTRIW